jgi:hypothetical protein
MLTDLFTIRCTQDYSPTLACAKTGEWMHSRGGALAETLHVYAGAAETAIAEGASRFVSVGLGAGYVDFVLLALLLAKPSLHKFVRLRSFEACSELRYEFIQSLEVRAIDEGSSRLFHTVAKTVAAHFEIDDLALMDFAQSLFANGAWRIESSLQSETQWPERADCIFFDVFSKQTSPELWDPAFLEHWLQASAGDPCTFTSYASNKTLRNALVKAGFVVETRPGFGGKRECTFAKRRSVSMTI